ncbi:MAG TPA: cupin domain-containing protein [Verrucomicrobiae bacterium]|nr:cupin domain-containing protein [Verrucomicrobiae bacterium]
MSAVSYQLSAVSHQRSSPAGEAEITIAGKRHRVPTGELIVMPANRPHALKAVHRFKMMLIMFRS